MRQLHLLTAAALTVGALAVIPGATRAQGQDWFVPNQSRAGGPAGRPAPGPRAVRQAPVPPPAEAMPFPPPGAEAEPEPPPQVQVELPPGPDVPALPKANPPPTAVIGVLGLAEISRSSVAAQAVDKALAERMGKLQEDARKEQASWRETQQQLAKVSPDQVRAKERELQERVTNAQKQFRDRNRIIQEAAQYARAQIERTLRQIVIRVSEAHGINIVLHQEQVVLNYPAFDITPEVVDTLNKVLPSVVLPPDGVAVSDLPGAKPVAQAKPGETSAAAAQAAPVLATPPPSVAPAPAPAPAAPATAAPAPSPPKKP